ncbi:MAG: N(5)-(carboxyethyl)ornithine synthase [Thermoanaerobaculia bacterium]
MNYLDIGVVATSRTENERRLPINPEHLDRIPAEIRPNLYFEKGYGVPFGIEDEELASEFGGVGSRAEVLHQPVVLLPKPVPADLAEMRDHGILWGWPHCVQQAEITQQAIDRKLTLLAWEAMFTWSAGRSDLHLFARNNEMAGYCGVLHAFQLEGVDGHYGRRRNAIVISFGSVSRGAIHALRGRGITDIVVYTQRPPWSVHDQIPGCRHGQIVVNGDRVEAIPPDGSRRPFVDVIAEADFIVNGILQDTDQPLMFLREGEEKRLKRGALIIDVSCDLAMGFPFARPTSFAEPIFRVGLANYYAVNHTPSYLWRAASWENSLVIIEFLERVLGGPASWAGEETLSRAVEILDGHIQNEKILSFQNRESEYPHAVRQAPAE